MRPFRFLTAATFVAAVLPRLAHRGMFVDGVTYAAIARNLAEGRGRFWAPSYTATIYPIFYDHPPLGFWLQSLWFRALGDHLAVERLYAVTAALLTASLIAWIWRQLQIGSDAARDGWLPIACWIAAPIVSWAIVGNLLETTVALFTTAAVGSSLRASRSNGWVVQAAAWSALSGLCVTAATLTKGPVGLFPLVGPFVFAVGMTPELAPGRTSTGARPQAISIVCVLAQWLTVAACGLAFFSAQQSRESLTVYLQQQVLAALSGQREMSASRLTIIAAWLQSVVLPMLVTGGVVAAAARRWISPGVQDRWMAVRCMSIGLAGTMPILLSTKQAGHYLVPTVPLYALGAALMVHPTLAELGRTMTAAVGRILQFTAALLVIGSIVAALAPGVGRDRQLLADLDPLAPVVPRGAIIGICPAANAEWGLHAWFQRRFRVSLDARDGRTRDWFLKTSADRDCLPTRCAPATDADRALVLLRCGG